MMVAWVACVRVCVCVCVCVCLSTCTGVLTTSLSGFDGAHLVILLIRQRHHAAVIGNYT